MAEVTVTVPAGLIRNVFGEFDENIRTLEEGTHTQILNRGDGLVVTGEDFDTDRARTILNDMIEVARSGEDVGVTFVEYLLSHTPSELSNLEGQTDISELLSDVILFTKAGKPIRPKTFGQKKYVNLIRQNLMTFAVGPAGTGKTYLAMAMAVDAFRKGEVSRLILTRPAIEAGERLGYLPGDLQSKIDPYLRPLYDALYEIMGPDSFNHNLERNVIEVAPLAYMRGRTLDNSFIVLDEAQNTTPAQMKMFLTRFGFGSKAVITGDLTQIDLPKDQKSGLREAVALLRNIEGIGICQLTKSDVVRHPLVQKIVEAYEKGTRHESVDHMGTGSAKGNSGKGPSRA